MVIWTWVLDYKLGATKQTTITLYHPILLDSLIFAHELLTSERAGEGQKVIKCFELNAWILLTDGR